MPVSVAMKRHEDQYLQALLGVSAPARELCDVLWAGDDEYFYTWKPHADEAFVFMDLTAAAEFTLSMAQTALEKDLLQETPWLRDFDAAYDQIKADHDGRDADLCTLITVALQNSGLISQNKRKSYADRVPGRVFDAIDALCTARLRLNPWPPAALCTAHQWHRTPAQARGRRMTCACSGRSGRCFAGRP